VKLIAMGYDLKVTFRIELPREFFRRKLLVEKMSRLCSLNSPNVNSAKMTRTADNTYNSRLVEYLGYNTSSIPFAIGGKLCRFASYNTYNHRPPFKEKPSIPHFNGLTLAAEALLGHVKANGNQLCVWQQPREGYRRKIELLS
jgi:hypothetical protein